MKYFLSRGLFIAFIFSCFTSVAQHDAPQKMILRHHMTLEEQVLMQNYQRDFSETLPPEGTVRNIAEWEPMESVIVAYEGDFGIPYTAIAEMSQDCMVTVLVSNSAEESTASQKITSNGGNAEHLDFVYHAVNSWWARDYSPWFIAVNDTGVAIVDFPYNRPRPQDDDVPIVMANHLNLPLYGMDVIQTGGNYMTDGLGISASTDLVVEENPSLSENEIQERMQNYLGIENYIISPDPLGDYIKHIDCWGKFLAPDKVLISQVPENDPRYNDYEAVAQIFANENCSYGYPFEVVRVQVAEKSSWDVTPYTNSLILNNKVFVPTSGSDLDDPAIQVYEENMPGYEIIPVFSSSSWLNTDALHCRTHGVADRQMLYIKHTPIHGEIEYASTLSISAQVHSYGQANAKSLNVDLFYKIGNNDWETTAMTANDNDYTAEIACPTGDFEVKYYISASDSNDKTAMHPIAGEADPHSFSYSSETIGLCDAIDLSFSLYPNPTRGLLYLKSNGTGSYQIVDRMGKALQSGAIKSERELIDLSELSAGIYFIKIQSHGKNRVEKIIKR